MLGSPEPSPVQLWDFFHDRGMVWDHLHVSIRYQSETSSLGQWVVPPWSILGSREMLRAPEGCSRL